MTTVTKIIGMGVAGTLLSAAFIAVAAGLVDRRAEQTVAQTIAPYVQAVHEDAAKAHEDAAKAAVSEQNAAGSAFVAFRCATDARIRAAEAINAAKSAIDASERAGHSAANAAWLRSQAQEAARTALDAMAEADLSVKEAEATSKLTKEQGDKLLGDLQELAKTSEQQLKSLLESPRSKGYFPKKLDHTDPGTWPNQAPKLAQ